MLARTLVSSLIALIPLVVSSQTPEWYPAQPLNHQRQRHSATLLNDGRVLVAGGAYDFWGEEVTATCEIYDPSTETWSSCASMSSPRSSHVAVLLGDGRVFVAGGYPGSGYATTTGEIYDPVTDTWTPTSSMSTKRYRHQGTLINQDQVLIVGGRQGNIDGHGTMDIWGPLASCEIYTISTDTWTSTGPMNQTRTECGLSLLPDGRILAAGGINDRDDMSQWAQPSTASCEIYDPVTNTWSYTDAYQSARNYIRLVTLDNNDVLSIGGELNKAALSSCELFRSNNDKWKKTGDLNAPRIIAEALKLPTGDIMTIGGWDYLWSAQTATAETYHVQSKSWESLPAMGTPRGWHTATLLNTGDILVVGGTAPNKSALMSCEVLRSEVPGTFKLFAVSDVPNDEGKDARLYWSSHQFDSPSSKDNRISSYRIYIHDDANGVSVSELPQGKWRLVHTTSATGSEYYYAVVPTLGASSVTIPRIATYTIVATTTAGETFVSNTHTGESFDNRGPAGVTELSVVRSGSKVTIQWPRSSATDVARYAVYRGDEPTFPVDPDHFLAETTSLTYTDDVLGVEGKIFYRVRAIDNSGNPGPATPAVRPQTSSVDRETHTAGLVVYDNYPQPFNNETILPIMAGNDVTVTLEIIDMLSRSVVAPRQINLRSGLNRVDITASDLPSGRYLCLIRSQGIQTSRQLLIQR